MKGDSPGCLCVVGKQFLVGQLVLRETHHCHYYCSTNCIVPLYSCPLPHCLLHTFPHCLLHYTDLLCPHHLCLCLSCSVVPTLPALPFPILVFLPSPAFCHVYACLMFFPACVYLCHACLYAAARLASLPPLLCLLASPAS